MNRKVSEPTYSFPEKNGEELLRELIIYISQQCQTDEYFGAIKLNKILWHADCVSYAFYGEPITGVEYMKLAKGPVPRLLVRIKQSMIDDHDIAEVPRRFGTYVQKPIVPLREPDLSKFSGRDISVIESVIKHLWGKSATDVSEESHLQGWKLAGYKESIPYEAIFLSDEGVTEKDEIRAKELIAEYGWDV
jgi:hypothetical protein